MIAAARRCPTDPARATSFPSGPAPYRRRAAAALILVLTGLAMPARPQPSPPPATESEPPLGTPTSFAPSDTPARIEVAPGTTLFRQPAIDGGMLLTLDAATSLELVEEAGLWARVRYGNFLGWVVLDPELRDAVALPAPARRTSGADPERLARARELLGEEVRESALGSYRFFTDVGRRKVLAALATLVEQLPSVYRSRYGLELPESEGEALVLFAREEDYRSYTAEESSIAELRTSGHAAPGLAVLYLGERRVEEMLAVMVHELVHLLNRRSVPGELPPWLEEGMAEDLAFSRIDLGGRIQPGTFGGLRRVRELDERLPDGRRRVTTNVETRGARASVQRLYQHFVNGEAPVLAHVLELPWRAFVAPAGRDLRYTQSACLVRYLLDGEEGRLAAAFRGYVMDAGAVAPASSTALVTSLGVELEELEAGYWNFVGSQVDKRFLD